MKEWAALIEEFLKREDRNEPEALLAVLESESLSGTDFQDLAFQMIQALYESYYQWFLTAPPMARFRGIQTCRSVCDKYHKAFQSAGYTLDEGQLVQRLMETEVRLCPQKRSFISFCEQFSDQTSFAGELQKKYPEKFKMKEDVKLDITEEYKLVRYVSSGGQKDVYEVVQQSTGQHLALKELRVGLCAHETHREALVEEVRLQSQLTHQSVPVIFSLRDRQGDPVFVERLVSGQSWDSIFRDCTLSQNLATLLKVAQVMAYAHKKGIIHLDLKPGNVMIDSRYGEIYVVDWGLAVALPQKEFAFYGGTDEYLPPEVAARRKEAIGKATDVFMLGAILYQLLTGFAPYEKAKAVSRQEALTCAKECRFPSVPAYSDFLKQPISVKLRRIVEKAMAKEPEARFATAEEFAQEIEKFIGQENAVQHLFHLQEEFQALLKRSMELETAALPAANMEFIGFITEFRRLREFFASAEKKDGELKTFWEVWPMEFEARMKLIRNSIRLQDFGIVSVQLELADKAMEQSQSLLAELPGCSEEPKNMLTEQLQTFQTLQQEYLSGLRAWQRMRQMKQLFVGACVVVFLLLVGLTWTVSCALDQARQRELAQQQLLQKQKELTDFEMDVLPGSLVIGYADNFLFNCLGNLEKEGEIPLFVIAIPKDTGDLNPKAREEAYVKALEPLGFSLEERNLAAPGANRKLFVKYFKRESDGKIVFFDVITTVSGFLSAIDYRKNFGQNFDGSADTRETDLFEKYMKTFCAGFEAYYGHQAQTLNMPEDQEKRSKYERYQTLVDAKTIRFTTSPDELVQLLSEK